MSAFRSTLSHCLLHPLTQIAIIVFFLIACSWMEIGTVQVMTFALVAIIFAQSVNVLTGIAGQITLGQAGFFGIGAYGTAILSKTHGFDLIFSIPLAAIISGVVGYLLSYPAGRVRDVYLAMMTLGFGMIFFEVVREWNSLTGGMMGMSGVASPALRSLTIVGISLDEFDYFRLVLIATAVILWVLHNAIQSPLGRAFYAIHANEMAAGSLGISRSGAKRQAFALSGVLAGIAGAFYAHLVGYLGPESFGITRSIEVLVISIVGGLGSIAGQVISAIGFTFLPETLQAFAEYQYIVYGLILTFALMVLPRGLAGIFFLPPRYIKPASLRAARRQQGARASGESPKALPITIEGLTKHFGGLTALKDISLTLEPGHITALIGPNGSGKSTLVNLVTGIYKPSSGRVMLGERDITGMPDYRIAREGIVRTFQDPRLVPHFTVRENLLLGTHRLARHRGFSAALSLPGAIREEADFLAEIAAVMELTETSDIADTTIDELPYGHCRLVEVARALLARPHTIMLDEPAAGLSEAEMEQLAKVIRRMKASGLTIMLIDHHMDFLADLVDSVVVLDSGEEIFRGTLEAMRSDPTVISAYLGEEDGGDDNGCDGELRQHA